jgi:hypothetical protein
MSLHRKAASTTSDCTYLQVNLHKQCMYWNAAFPDGVSGESTRDVIDIDESNYKLESQNQKFGKMTRERRCYARGKYKKGAGSVSLLMAISGDERVGEAFSFHRCFTEGGTNMRNLMDWLVNNRPGQSFLFTTDNLNLHRHLVTTNLIYARGHLVVFQASYWSCDGAIEYIFNMLQTRLQME